MFRLAIIRTEQYMLFTSEIVIESRLIVRRAVGILSPAPGDRCGGPF